MYFIGGEEPQIVRTFVLDYIERSISDHPERPISIIIRKEYLAHSNSAFGYYRALVAHRVKRIVYKYLDSFERIVTFLLGLVGENIEYKIENIVIEGLEEFTGSNLIQTGNKLVILFNSLEKIRKILVNSGSGKEFGSLIVSASGSADYMEKIANFVSKIQRYTFVRLLKSLQHPRYYLLKNGESYTGESLQYLKQIQEYYDKKKD